MLPENPKYISNIKFGTCTRTLRHSALCIILTEGAEKIEF